MGWIKETTWKILKGDINIAYQQHRGVTYLAAIKACSQEGNRGKARRIIEIARPGIQALNGVIDSGFFPEVDLKRVDINRIKRQLRKPPQRRRGHSKWWAAPR